MPRTVKIHLSLIGLPRALTPRSDTLAMLKIKLYYDKNGRLKQNTGRLKLSVKELTHTILKGMS